jgi:hypothetical protein
VEWRIRPPNEGVNGFASHVWRQNQVFTEQEYITKQEQEREKRETGNYAKVLNSKS